MPYTIHATSPVGALSYQRDTLEQAHQKAVELQNGGYLNVTIHNPQGEDVSDTDEERDFNERH